MPACAWVAPTAVLERVGVDCSRASRYDLSRGAGNPKTGSELTEEHPSPAPPIKKPFAMLRFRTDTSIGIET